MTQRKYSSIGSPYIRSRIVSTPFEDRGFINTLVSLHGWIRNPPTTASSARAYSITRQRHNDAWVALFLEYSEDAYAAWIAESERAEQERQMIAEREAHKRQAQERAELEDWLRAGGLPDNPESGE
ncbi:MAG: hypothetical protein ABIE42_09710 [Candidatus Eisenbacteria bacterium]